MDKKLLQKTFREYKKAAGVDFSITAPDSYGDCQSCVWSTLVDKYGYDCHGVFVKAWKHGMNGGSFIEELDHVLVGHDITAEQAEAFYKVFGESYIVYPREYDENTCFYLFEKGKKVYEVSYTYTGTDGKEYTRSEAFAEGRSFRNQIEWSIENHDSVQITRIRG